MMMWVRLATLVVGILFSVLLPIPLPALQAPQSAADVQQPSSINNAASHSASGQGTTIKVNVRLVPVRVVVRDSTGHAIGGLKSGDFEVYDNGKLQEIRQFSAESAEPSSESAVRASHEPANAPSPDALP